MDKEMDKGRMGQGKGFRPVVVRARPLRRLRRHRRVILNCFRLFKFSLYVETSHRADVVVECLVQALALLNGSVFVSDFTEASIKEVLTGIPQQACTCCMSGCFSTRS